MSSERESGERFATVEEAAEEFRRGRFVILIDDEDRENEGDLAIPAELITPDSINFMATHARGLICVALTPERCDALELTAMVEHNTSLHQTAFCVSVEARNKVTTGISAADRAATVQTLLDPATRPEDLIRPGHTFPLRARQGGVLKRAGHTEASVDLARLAGLTPAAVICEIMDTDGTMARVPRLLELAREHGLKVLTVRELIAHRMRNERLVERIAAPVLPTRYGDFRVYAFRSKAAVRQSFLRRYHRKLDVSRHKFGGLAVALRHVLPYVIVRRLARNLAGEPNGVKCGNPPYSARAGAKTRPHFVRRQSEGGYRAKAGYYYAS